MAALSKTKKSSTVFKVLAVIVVLVLLIVLLLVSGFLAKKSNLSKVQPTNVKTELTEEEKAAIINLGEQFKSNLQGKYQK